MATVGPNRAIKVRNRDYTRDRTEFRTPGFVFFLLAQNFDFGSSRRSLGMPYIRSGSPVESVCTRVQQALSSCAPATVVHQSLAFFDLQIS